MAFISYTTQGFILLLAAACLLVTEGEAKTFVVGGNKGWRFGFNYTDWVLENSPFYINDELVFKYDPPSKNSKGYSVYLLPNLWSYASCDFSKAKLLAGPNQGGGKGFRVELNQWRPYYLASGDKDGKNCKDGHMKLFAVPLPHWNMDIHY